MHARTHARTDARASTHLHAAMHPSPRQSLAHAISPLTPASSLLRYLEVERRVEVLNKRLDIIKELFDMLANELHNSHSSMLEWIVIVLILVEVFFQVLSLILNGSLE
eukprot:2364289-Pleurochrysis_carterae.AAC.5